MNSSSPEPWLDDLLRAPHVDDDGFADSVALALPPPRRRTSGVVFAFGLIAVVVGAVVVRSANADITALHTNLVVLISAAVVLALAASLSGEHLRVSPAMLGASLPALPLPDSFGSGSGSSETRAPVAVPSLRPSSSERALRHDLDDLDDADFALIGRVGFGRSFHLGLSMVGLMFFSVVATRLLPRFTDSGWLELVATLMTVTAAYCYFLFRDARTTFLDAGFTPDLARRLGRAAARRGLVVDRKFLQNFGRLTEETYAARGREIVETLKAS